MNSTQDLLKIDQHSVVIPYISLTDYDDALKQTKIFINNLLLIFFSYGKLSR